jgi:retron-type reverse transcriptase
MEDGEIHANTEGTPQGGSISVLLSNLYLHYVLDLWFTKVVKTHLQGNGVRNNLKGSKDCRNRNYKGAAQGTNSQI